MSAESTTITFILTPEQRKQVKDATGQDVTELQLNVAIKGQLSAAELEQVHGGLGCATGKHIATAILA